MFPRNENRNEGTFAKTTLFTKPPFHLPVILSPVPEFPGKTRTRKKDGCTSWRPQSLRPKKGKYAIVQAPKIRRTQEGCGGLGGENPAAFPKAWPIFQQSFFLPEKVPKPLGRDSILFCPKIGENFSSSVEICRKTFPASNFGQPQPSRVF